MSRKPISLDRAIIRVEKRIAIFSHQRLVVISMINKGIGADFSEKQLEEAIDHVDFLGLKTEIEKNVIIEDLFAFFTMNGC